MPTLHAIETLLDRSVMTRCRYCTNVGCAHPLHRSSPLAASAMA